MPVSSGRRGAFAATGIALLLVAGWWLRRPSAVVESAMGSAHGGDTTATFGEALEAMSGNAGATTDPDRIVGTWARLFGVDSIAGCRLKFDGRRGGQARFALSCNRGAPSYNMGEAEGEIPLRGDTAIYRDTIMSGRCELRFVFGDSGVTVTQEEEEVGCGFGYGVMADGAYQLLRAGTPQWDEGRNPQ